MKVLFLVFSSPISVPGYDDPRFHSWKGLGWRSPKGSWRSSVVHMRGGYTDVTNE